MDTRDIELAEKRLEEETFFKDRINLETGEIIEGNDFDPQKSVVVEFNEETSDNFTKILQAILESRGVKNPDDITKDDPDVREVLAKRLRRKRGELKGREARKTSLSNQEISAVVNGAIRSHKPHFNTALMQTIIYLILVNDLFYEEKNGAIGSRFEVEIPEDYWEGINRVVSKNSIIDKVLSEGKDFVVASPYFDPENPLERMIAFTTVFLEENNGLSDAIVDKYLNKVMAYVSLGGRSVLRKLDNFQTFSDILDELLHSDVGEEDKDEQRENTSEGVGGTTETVEEPGGSRKKRKAEETDTNAAEE